MNSQPVLVNGVSNSPISRRATVRLRGRWLLFARLGWILISLSAAILLITALTWNTVAWWNVTEATCENARCVAHVQFFGDSHFVAIYYVIGASIEMFPWVLVGALIFWRKSNDPFALLFSLSLVLTGVFLVDDVVPGVIGEHFPTFRFPLQILQTLAFALPILWYGFPDGQIKLRNLRWIAACWLMFAILSLFFPGTLLDFQTWPLPYPQLMLMIFALSVGVALVYRYRRVSDFVQRQQIRWVVSTGAVYVSLFAPSFLIWNWSYEKLALNMILRISYLPLLYIGSAVFAGGIGVSILRYRLWDINIIINRTLVYSSLTISVLAIYVLVVGVLGTAIQGHSNLLISILATGLVALLVQPLRDRLQRGINRMMYGERDDPVTVLSQLGQRLEGTLAPDAVLPSLVETVAQTLKLPYVAIETMADQRLDATSVTDPSPTGIAPPTIAYGHFQSDLIRFPLIYQSETIGQLLVAPRSPGEPLSPMDHHLLENIAHQAGLAMHAVSLTADLQRSRQHLVTAREEERRRLRRDLHDGLGPNLASQGLKLAGVKQLLGKDPVSAIQLLDQVMMQNQSTVEEVRRLVYGLRPPALDELGLVAAIRDHVAGMNGKSALQIEISEPDDGLPPLSAAVEVAAYRIVLEALTNVIRHAQARHCAIRFSCHQNNPNALLQIEIVDDGMGLAADLRAGVGLRSMRERAEELGGRLIVESRPGVTRVSAILPINETIAQADPAAEAQKGHPE